MASSSHMHPLVTVCEAVQLASLPQEGAHVVRGLQGACLQPDHRAFCCMGAASMPIKLLHLAECACHGCTMATSLSLQAVITRGSASLSQLPRLTAHSSKCTVELS